jgi:hypothetical protein
VDRRGDAGRGQLDCGAGEAEEQLPDRLAVEDAVVGLVRVAEEAVVAGRLAVLAGGRGAPEIVSRRGIEVAELEGARTTAVKEPASSTSRRRTPAPPSAAS